MNHTRIHKSCTRTATLICLLLLVQTSLVAAQDITGEWEMTLDRNGWIRYVTLTISKNADGTLAGKWGPNDLLAIVKNVDGTLRYEFGSSDLSNVKFQDGKLTFVRIYRFGKKQLSETYNGTLMDGKLMGLLSPDQGRESAANGARKKPTCPALGQWDMNYHIGERDVTGKLVISEKPDGTLDGKWISERGGSEISNVKFQDGKLTFARKSTFNDRTFESTFEGTVKGHDLAGTFKSERGEMAATGKRIGAALVGKWELIGTSEGGGGTATPILTVNGDLSGRYGTPVGEIPVKDLKLEGNQVTFAIERSWTSKLDFKGTLDGDTLKGQMTSERGTSSEVTGKKLAAATVSAVAGTWELTSESSQGGTRTNTLKIKDDMTATYTSRDTETPVTDLKVEGDQISFKVTRTFNDQQVTMEFKGKVDGKTLKGDFVSPRGSRPVTGKKID